ncbi:glycosyltransferase [Nocardioides dongxiaopingii]|uniref:glycosyltransferase n=1 Tax=Nocardioides sp. S-1144 TaxID=2582905 RepID=UPI001162DB12|nr:glycosyltransferase [Nocardioides sp. S-1144]QDH10914.1 glycosyltransferase [Nocardioides sp. S-1144]
MRVLVYPHDLSVGGSQLNAVELAAAVRERGHDVLVHGVPGPLVERVHELGLEFVPSAPVGRRPTPGVVASLAQVAAERQVDVLHGYEWPPGLECHLAALRSPAVAVTTVMSMAVAPFLPRTSHLVVGTEQIAAHERARGRQRTSLLEPPVDLAVNGPDVPLDLAGFRARWGLDDGRPTVVLVTRLARQLKLEGVVTALEAISRVVRTTPARLLVVGDGECRAEVRALSEEVDRVHGPGTVVLTGELADPRPAYAVADVALGMGGSALRAMAFGAPLVVLGEGGYVAPLTEQSLPGFLWRGWYGYGPSGAGTPAEVLADLLTGLLEDPARRAAAGALGRRVVEDRFSLVAAARRQEAVYEAALADRPSSAATVGASARSVGEFAAHHLRRRARRIAGAGATEDFNASPLARDGRAPAGAGAVLWFAGASWDAVAGTDRHLATAVARDRTVVWVDPPMSFVARRRRGVDVAPVTEPWPGVVRVNTVVVPGVSRPVLRRVTRSLAARHAAHVVRRRGLDVDVVVVSDPEQTLPQRAGRAVRVYFETDDFVAGAALLGSDAGHAERRRRTNVRRSDVVLAITTELAGHLAALGAWVRVLPNGADAEHYRDVDGIAAADEVTLDRPLAGVVGQLNDRLDLDALDAVAGTGSRLLLLGPRHEQDPATRRRLDALIAHPNVQWVDRQPFARLPAFMSAIDVGLTPYAVTEFNRGSHPLKTLEYLAAGRSVVSTDLPASRALGAALVTVATSPAGFAEATVRQLAEAGPGRGGPAASGRRAFAMQHTWTARAGELLAICHDVRCGRAGARGTTP